MKKILVCLDGSIRERGVLDAAVMLATSCRSTLVLFRAAGIPVELPHEALSMPIDDVPRLLERRARNALEEMEKTVPVELRGGVRAIIGTPWQSIELAAREENVDLIVIGSHGYQALDRVLGTTAAKVVNHADRAVLVVRAPERLTAP